MSSDKLHGAAALLDRLRDMPSRVLVGLTLAFGLMLWLLPDYTFYISTTHIAPSYFIQIGFYVCASLLSANLAFWLGQKYASRNDNKIFEAKIFEDFHWELVDRGADGRVTLVRGAFQITNLTGSIIDLQRVEMIKPHAPGVVLQSQIRCTTGEDSRSSLIPYRATAQAEFVIFMKGELDSQRSPIGAKFKFHVYGSSQTHAVRLVYVDKISKARQSGR